jgi:hypothetical protein
MTIKQAQKKADELWGKGKEWASNGGYVQKRPSRKFDGLGPDPTQWPPYMYDVGHITLIAGIAMFSVKGSGKTWEEAFAHAEERVRKDREEMAARRAKLNAAK